jgi:hypothetical protein
MALYKEAFRACKAPPSFFGITLVFFFSDKKVGKILKNIVLLKCKLD